MAGDILDQEAHILSSIFEHSNKWSKYFSELQITV